MSSLIFVSSIELLVMGDDAIFLSSFNRKVNYTMMSRIALVLIGILILAGCSSCIPKSKIVGNWFAEDAVAKGLTTMDGAMEFHEDNSYRFWFKSSRTSVETKGIYKIKGNKIYVSVTSELKNGVSQPIKYLEQIIVIESLSETKMEFDVIQPASNTLFTYVRKPE